MAPGQDLSRPFPPQLQLRRGRESPLFDGRRGGAGGIGEAAALRHAQMATTRRRSAERGALDAAPRAVGASGYAVSNGVGGSLRCRTHFRRAPRALGRRVVRQMQASRRPMFGGGRGGGGVRRRRGATGGARAGGGSGAAGLARAGGGAAAQRRLRGATCSAPVLGGQLDRCRCRRGRRPGVLLLLLLLLLLS